MPFVIKSVPLKTEGLKLGKIGFVNKILNSLTR